jgi:hypothetical protein
LVPAIELDLSTKMKRLSVRLSASCEIAPHGASGLTSSDASTKSEPPVAPVPPPSPPAPPPPAPCVVVVVLPVAAHEAMAEGTSAAAESAASTSQRGRSEARMARR